MIQYLSWNCFVPWSKFSIQFILQPLPVCCSPLLPYQVWRCKWLPIILALENATLWSCQCLVWLSIQISLFNRLIYKGTMFCLCKNVLDFKAMCLAWKVAFLSKIFLCWCGIVMYKVISGDNTALKIVTSASGYDRLLHLCSFQDAVANLLSGTFFENRYNLKRLKHFL